MRSERPSILYVIPALVVLAALVALVALPLFVNVRTNRMRRELELKAVPARAHLNQVNYELSVQIANLLRWSVTQDDREMQAYRRAGIARQQAMQLLAKDVVAIGEREPQTHYRDLHQEIAHWEEGVEEQLRSGRRGAAAHEIFSSEKSRYVAVVERVKSLDEAISDFESERRMEVIQLMERQFWISAAVVVIALIAAAGVLLLFTNVRSIAGRLEQVAEERMEALEREHEARATAESLLKARDEILGIVSHDLRSPLTTITLSTQLLPGSPADEQSEHVNTILTTARRMERLIQDLLDAVKIENSKLAVKKETLDLSVVFKTAIDSQKPIAAQKKIGLTMQIDDALPRMSGDRDRLVQALVNILGNALKFTPEGGVVKLHAATANGIVNISITDSGPGIPESDLPHLFEPFWQSKKTAHLGAGLGLKIARAIVEAHGGTIDAGNSPEGGARFSLAIPAG